MQPLDRIGARVTGASTHIPVDAAPRAPYLPPMDNPIIDARDLLCPLPVLRLRKALDPLPPGTTVTLLATDPAAEIDVPHFCMEQGHTFLGSAPDANATAYRVQRGP